MYCDHQPTLQLQEVEAKPITTYRTLLLRDSVKQCNLIYLLHCKIPKFQYFETLKQILGSLLYCQL